MTNRSGDFQKKFHAFTLIELLIVVAIIAILAAIAVPNFLEAQTRSKISRAKADMRTIATGLETYAIDNNRTIVGRTESGVSSSPDDPILAALIPDAVREDWKWSHLTSPVAYLTSIPLDPFLTQGMVRKGGANLERYYQFEAFVPTKRAGSGPKTWRPRFRGLKDQGYDWVLHSWGPSRKYSNDMTWNDISSVLAGAGGPDVYPGGYYDPTNGTVSSGWIIRTNRGIEPASPLK